jgi:hypothetical protein
MGSIGPTFEAALRAVGTAATMAFAGFYLHRRNFVTPSGKKMMVIHEHPCCQSCRTILAMHDSNLKQTHLLPLIQGSSFTTSDGKRFLFLGVSSAG